MKSHRTKLVSALICLFAVAAIAITRSNSVQARSRPDLKPCAHWSFEPESLTSRKLVDRCGKLEATLLGSPAIVSTDPTFRIEMNQPEDGVLVRTAVSPEADYLPRAAASVIAWVRLDDRTEWGGILSCFQDNGPNKSGFVLGYDKSGFYFALSTGADGQQLKMTYLRGKSKYQLGRWYHVVGVYDGKEMKLFVNGELDGTSVEASGPIRYTSAAPLTIGRYRDENEDFPLRGAIREVLLCTHAVSASAISDHFAADRELAEFESNAQEGKPQFVVEPYLQFATRTSMNIMWETDVPCSAIVEYGLNSPPKQEVKVAKLDVMGEVPLRDLEPGRKYFYRVVCTDEGGRKLESKLLSFGTAVDPSDAFSFTVIGDTQRNPQITAKIAKLMWERRPNFVIHCGDVVDDGAAKWQWTGDLFKPCQELFGRVPVYPCIGNHEKNHAQYYKYFSLPAPEYYYSYKYGNAEFFVLDTNTRRTADLKPGGEQYQWLEKALAASDAKWKFCYHHHPVYSSDSDDYGDTFKGSSTDGDVRVRPLQALYEKYKVDIVFNGHIHLYERSWPVREGKVDQKNGVIHVTSGGGGGSLETFGPTPTFFKQECRVDFHFCYLTLHQGALNFKAFDQEGRLFDYFSLKKE